MERQEGTHTDFWIGPDTPIRFTHVGAGKTEFIILKFGNFAPGLDIYIQPDAFSQLLNLSNVAETAWSTSLKKDES